MKAYDIILSRGFKTYRVCYLSTSAQMAAWQAEQDYPGYDVAVIPHTMVEV